MTRAQWDADRIGEKIPLGDLNVHYHDGAPDWDGHNWRCSYVVWVDTDRDVIVAEKQSHEVTEITWPSETAPETIRRVRREVLGEVPCGNMQAAALFGRVIVPLLEGEWITVDDLQVGDSVMQWAYKYGSLGPNFVRRIDRLGNNVVLHLDSENGMPFANPRPVPYYHWVQVERGTSDLRDTVQEESE
jgi:hypothetical protein